MTLLDFAAPRPAGPFAPSYVAGPRDTGDVERVRAFWRRVERYAPGMQVGVEAASTRGRQLIVVSGWACELRILPDGRRQIFGFLLPGDLIDTAAMSNLGVRGVMALTHLQVVEAESDAAGAGGAPVDAAAGWRREQRLYDHMVRMGRLTARERVLHLLLELCERLEGAGLVRGESFRIPLTQELFADTLGLSVVHINRTLKALRQEGCITLKAGSVTLHNRPRLATACCYHSLRDAAAFQGERPAGHRRRGADD